MKIQKKGLLRVALHNEGYDHIILYEDGRWCYRSTGDCRENYGDYLLEISRVHWYGLSWKKIDKLLKFIESSNLLPIRGDL